MWIAVIIAALSAAPQSGKKADDRKGKEPSPTEKEQLDFARRIEGAVAKGDIAGVDALFDEDRLATIAVSDASVPKSLRGSALEAGFRKGFPKGFSFGKAVVQGMGDGGSYKFLRLVKVDGKPAALFRLLAKGGGVNYHEVFLGKDAAGSVKAHDLNVFVMGELMSETVRRLYLQSAAEKDRSLLEKLTGKGQDLMKSLPRLPEMQRLQAEGKAKKALEIYSRLPSSVKKEKCFLVLRVSLTSESADEEYQAAIADFENAFPGDPALDLVSVDGFFLKRDFKRALETLDRLDRRVGGDPYLNVLRSTAHLELGSLEKARTVLERAVKDEPTLEDAYWALVTVSLKARNFKETTRLLSLLEKDFGAQLADLADVELYAEFTKSKEYEAWLAARKPKEGER